VKTGSFFQASCVAISGRGILISGAVGSGKSSLAMGLIDRGAVLVGDDGVMLQQKSGQLIAASHPETLGLIEVRNLGLLTLPFVAQCQIALHITLDMAAPRYISEAEHIELYGISIPTIGFWPQSPILPIKAEMALQLYGLKSGQ
jgi:serine kinase of HPr protein (carbohydrate metabolism regulator)